jgi:hypothetical protein
MQIQQPSVQRPWQQNNNNSDDNDNDSGVL